MAKNVGPVRAMEQVVDRPVPIFHIQKTDSLKTGPIGPKTPPLSLAVSQHGPNSGRRFPFAPPKKTHKEEE